MPWCYWTLEFKHKSEVYNLFQGKFKSQTYDKQSKTLKQKCEKHRSHAHSSVSARNACKAEPEVCTRVLLLRMDLMSAGMCWKWQDYISHSLLSVKLPCLDGQIRSGVQVQVSTSLRDVHYWLLNGSARSMPATISGYGHVQSGSAPNVGRAGDAMDTERLCTQRHLQVNSVYIY